MAASTAHPGADSYPTNKDYPGEEGESASARAKQMAGIMRCEGKDVPINRPQDIRHQIREANNPDGGWLMVDPDHMVPITR